MKMLQRAQAVLDVEIEELQRVRQHIGKSFNAAARLILASLQHGGKIVVTGVGKSYHIAQKIAATLASTGSTSVVLHPAQAMHGDIGMFCAPDILLALSYSGESHELTELAAAVKRQKGKIVAMTAGENSALARYSDAIINTAVKREACPFNLAPTASTTAMLAVGDALAIALAEARGFCKADFARLHPGGAIGRTLLVRVSDIMRQGERLAMVKRDARVNEAIVAMTGTKSGAVAIVDARKKLLGIFTDGDLRRLVSQRERVLDLPIYEVMTANPITVLATAQATEALKLIEKYLIDDIPVVDAKQCLVGMIDSQDLPKFKIF